MQSVTFSEFIAESKKLGPDWIFRGLKKSYKLKTTLERETNKIYGFQEYMRLLQRCVPEVEAHTGRHWNQLGRDVPINFYNLQFNRELASFMIYMRHHGFPSPIMDWTRSPSIAAYFAFSNVDPLKEDSSKIVAYHRQNEARAFWDGEAHIKLLDPSEDDVKRHHSQQSVYTVCCKSYENNDVFCSYEEVDDSRFIEFELCAKRNDVLKRLDRMNINAHALFHDEDGLASSLGLRTFSN